MSRIFDEFKEKLPLLVTLSGVASVVIGGSLTKAIVDAMLAGYKSILADAVMNSINNITNFSFLTGMFADFGLFLKITLGIFAIVFILYFMAKYNESNKSEYEGKENGSSQWSNGTEDYKHDSNEIGRAHV